MEKAIFYKNLKFWSKHTIINAIPSFVFALIHEWSSLESIIAMFFGIGTYTFIIAYYTSISSTQNLLNQPIIKATIKAGIFMRMVICIAPLVLSFFTVLNYTIGIISTSPLQILGNMYAGEFITGIVSHEFYRGIVDILPFHVTDVRNFMPTLIITLIQGFLLTCMLLVIGVFLSPFSLILNSRKEHARL